LRKAKARDQKRAKTDGDEGVKEGYSFHRNSFLADGFGMILPKWGGIYKKKGRVSSQPCLVCCSLASMSNQFFLWM